MFIIAIYHTDRVIHFLTFFFHSLAHHSAFIQAAAPFGLYIDISERIPLDNAR